MRLHEIAVCVLQGLNVILARALKSVILTQLAMHFSPCVLVVAASQQQLFQAPVQPDLASFVGVEVNPAVYGAAAAPLDGALI